MTFFALWKPPLREQRSARKGLPARRRATIADWGVVAARVLASVFIEPFRLQPPQATCRQPFLHRGTFWGDRNPNPKHKSPNQYKLTSQGGGAERRQWRKKRGGSPVSKGAPGRAPRPDAGRPLRTEGGPLVVSREHDRRSIRHPWQLPDRYGCRGTEGLWLPIHASPGSGGRESAVLSVRNGRAASAPRGHPRTPLLTGLPPPQKAQSKAERREGACNRAAKAQRRPFAVEEGQGSGWSFRLAGGSGTKRTLARRGGARLHPLYTREPSLGASGHFPSPKMYKWRRKGVRQLMRGKRKGLLEQARRKL